MVTVVNQGDQQHLSPPKFLGLMGKSTQNLSCSHQSEGFRRFSHHFWNKQIQYQVRMDVTIGHHCPTGNAEQLS